MSMVWGRVIGRGYDKEDGINAVGKDVKKEFFLSIYIEYIELCSSVCIAWFYFFSSPNRLTWLDFPGSCSRS